MRPAAEFSADVPNDDNANELALTILVLEQADCTAFLRLLKRLLGSRYRMV